MGLTPAPRTLSAGRGAAAQVARRCPPGPLGESLPLWLGQCLVLSDVGDPRAGTVASSRCPTSWFECGRLTSCCAERGCTLAQAGPALPCGQPHPASEPTLGSPGCPAGPGPRVQRDLGTPGPPSSPLPWSLAPGPHPHLRRLELDTFWLVLGLHPSCSPCLFLREQFCSHFRLFHLQSAAPGPPRAPPKCAECAVLSEADATSEATSHAMSGHPSPAGGLCAPRPHLVRFTPPLSFVSSLLSPPGLGNPPRPGSPHTAVPARPVSSLPSSRASRNQPGPRAGNRARPLAVRTRSTGSRCQGVVMLGSPCSVRAWRSVGGVVCRSGVAV